ncbi:DUF1036 domain-containing protein [Arenimonas composti]|uniref:DUF1036 domain-containing protein n=1 Tax=Arenimonas composti TR7-09 = DSM 18010 TaxID=1121013 RepID=A0A091BFJ6_9GAMM|nr:DUF1036 domain-containing protein [Arenimonas composti]KFN50327.1 hypothetical protein P873_06530 [Arenimonas composti TR7-09 = DSM 18010]
MSRTAILAAASVLLAGLAIAPESADAQNKRFKGSSAPAARSSEGLLKIQVCNRSRQGASVALSFIEPGDTEFINRGWFTVRAGECKILGQTDNATFYGYADVEGTDRFWGGNHTLCVEYPGPYTFYTARDGYCTASQDTRDFVVLTATEAGTFTWNLDP